MVEMMGRNISGSRKRLESSQGSCHCCSLPDYVLLRFLCELPSLLSTIQRASTALLPLSENIKIKSCTQRGHHEPLGLNPSSWGKSSYWHSVHLWSSVCGQGEGDRERLRVKTHLFHLCALYTVEER